MIDWAKRIVNRANDIIRPLSSPVFKDVEIKDAEERQKKYDEETKEWYKHQHYEED